MILQLFTVIEVYGCEIILVIAIKETFVLKTYFLFHLMHSFNIFSV